MTFRLRADWPAQVTEDDDADHPTAHAVEPWDGMVNLCSANRLGHVLSRLSPESADRLSRFLAAGAEEARRQRRAKREAS